MSESSGYSSIALKYAKALFELARENKIIEETKGELENFIKEFESDSELKILLLSEKLKLKHKEELVRKIWGDRLTGLVYNFMLILLRKSRVKFLNEIKNAYDYLYDSANEVIRVNVISAYSVSPDIQSRLEKTLVQLTGKKVIIDSKLDSSLIGGLSIELEYQIIDGTVKYKLDSLRKTMLN